MKFLILVTAIIFFSGCAPTVFRGEAHVTPQQCLAKCKSWGMVLESMVAMGEYSDACVCTRKRRNRVSSAAAPGAGAATVGVIMQTRRQQQANNNTVQQF